MASCPKCHGGILAEVIVWATECCEVTLGKGAPRSCPECGAINPHLVEVDRYYECNDCGYVEKSPTAA